MLQLRYNKIERQVIQVQIGEKIKQMRKDKGYSQEKLAEALGVSRQAVTKWENDTGIPDIENIISLAKIFGISTDELLLKERNQPVSDSPNLSGSVTEYDIDAKKHFDLHMGGAKRIVVTESCNEKIKIDLISSEIPNVSGAFKVKIDDNKSNTDVDIFMKNGMTESQARENLEIFVYLPKELTYSFELAANAETIELRDIKCDGIELDVKADKVVINKVESRIELDCNLNMTVICETLEASIDVNQLSACSKLFLPEDTDFGVSAKGRSNSIFFEDNRDFSTANTEKIIALNGRKSELVICRLTK